MSRTNGKKKAKKKEENPFRYLPCRVEPGMFRGEWLVHLEAASPQKPREPVRVQLLVDESDVLGISGTPQRRNPVPAWLRVSFAGSRSGLTEVVLPQPAYPDPFNVRVVVPEAMAQEEPGS